MRREGGRGETGGHLSSRPRCKKRNEKEKGDGRDERRPENLWGGGGGGGTPRGGVGGGGGGGGGVCARKRKNR